MKKRIYVIIIVALSIPLYSFNWSRYFIRMDSVRYTPFDVKDFVKQIGGKSHSRKNHSHNTNVLYKAIMSNDTSTRAKAVITIAKLKYTNFSKTLLSMLNIEREKPVIKLIIWGIGSIGTNDDVLALTQYSYKITDKKILTTLSLAIGKIARRGGSIQPLIHLIKTTDSLMVKCSSLLSLGKLKAREALDVVYHHSKDRVKEVRFCAAIALSFILSPADNYKEKLYDLINNEASDFVRAALYFAVLKTEGYAPPFYKRLVGYLMLHDGVSGAAADFLSDLPYKDGIGYLEIAFRSAISKRVKRRIEYVMIAIREKIKELHFRRANQSRMSLNIPQRG
jgi:hypothetical protein